MTNQQGAPEALRLADWLQNAVATYPQVSEDEPGGYCQEVDQVMDEAATELRRLHAENVRLAALVEAQQPAPSAAAEWLEHAFREGWSACRDAEFVGEEAEDWAFGNSQANGRMIGIQQAAPQPSPTPQADSAPHPIDPAIAADLERSDWTPEEALRWYAAGKHYDTVPNGDGSSSARILDNGAVASNALKSMSREYAEHKGDVALLEPQADSQPAAGAVAGPVDDLAELALLNRLIELGSKAAGAHARSNSDDGHKGTAAYVEWQELRAEMGELIRTAYAAAPTPPAQAADSALKDHQIAALVNELRDIAIQYHSTQQLRERIARAVVPAFKARVAGSVLEDAARYRFLAEHCRSTSEHWGGRWSIIINGPAPKSHDSEDDFDEAVDAARKQGANHD